MNVVPDLMITLLVLMIALVPTIFSEGCLELQEYHVKSDISLTLKLSSKVKCPNKIRIYHDEFNFPETSSLLENDKAAIMIDFPNTKMLSGRHTTIDNMLNGTGRKAPIKLILTTYYRKYDFTEQQNVNEIMSKIKKRFSKADLIYLPELRNETQHGRFIETEKPAYKKGNTISIDGLKVEMRRRNSVAAYLWIPEHKVIVGGIGVYWGIHPRIYEAHTKKMRLDWQNVLQEMIKLKPKIVIPGSYDGKCPPGDGAIRFTLEYLKKFENVFSTAGGKNFEKIISAMETAYPKLGRERNLEEVGHHGIE